MGSVARHRRVFAAAAAAATVVVVAVGSLAGCRDGAPGSVAAPTLAPGTPVVLISIDTLRADHLPAYGYNAVATPAIDALRADGVLYTLAFSHVPLTFPSHATILSGLLPHQHGVRDNTGRTLDAARLPWLPRQLRDAGYATAAAVSALVLARGTGVGDGFGFYEDTFSWRAGTLLGQVQRPGSETLATVLPWLREHADGPFFLFLHLYEPHSPWAPPSPFSGRHPDPYDGEIEAADAVVATLVAELRQLGAYDRSLVVLLSDHGEGLGDHGEREHGVLLYREALHVPLLLKLPRSERAGATVTAAVGLVDVAPTLRGLTGAAPDPRQQGVPLLAHLGGPPPTATPVLAESLYGRLHFGWSPLVAVVDGDWHYIHGPDPELYDLARDPAERRNRIVEDRPATRRLRDLALALPLDAVPAPQPLAPEDAARLAALGYVGSVAATPPASGPLPDPKREIGALDDLTAGFQAFARGDHAAAVPLLEAAVARHPRLTEGWEYLAQALTALGRTDAAIDAYRAGALAATPAPHLTAGAARLLAGSGRRDAALAIVDEALARIPDAAALLALRVRFLLLADDAPAAVATAERLAVAAPDVADVQYELGVARLMAGDAAGAESALRRALVIDPGHLRAMNDLAVLLRRDGRVDEAARLLTAVLAHEPDNDVARRNLDALRAGG